MPRLVPAALFCFGLPQKSSCKFHRVSLEYVDAWPSFETVSVDMLGPLCCYLEPVNPAKLTYVVRAIAGSRYSIRLFSIKRSD